VTEQAQPIAPSPSSGTSRRRWHFGRAILDERTLELLVDDVDAELERKPLEVLIYLLQHAGEVCTKDELLAGIWPGRILSETVLTKCIGRLRDVLGDDDQEIIKTAYGFGYRFVAPVRVESVATPEPARFDLGPGVHPPSRPLWSLVERLGSGGHGEAWRARHDKTNEQHVFKFALQEAALVALKREITLFRVINDTLGENAKVVKLLDWNLEQIPYFVEAEYIAGGSLVDWVAVRGGVTGIPLSDRLEIVAKIADALAAVHSVGVLHKDLKPSNVLVNPLAGNEIEILLGDFGSGGVLDGNRLEELGITRLGFTKTVSSTDSSSATPLYLAPEILAGQPFTVKSDIYALGIILYQFLAGDFHKVMSPGWERDIEDELLREDIALMAEGNPAERMGDADGLARRLRALDERRRQLAAEREAKAKEERTRRLLDRARARRFGLVVALGILVIGLIVSTGLYYRARQAQRRAEQAVATTQAVSAFLSRDLFGSIDLRKRSVRDLTVKELLDAGAAKIDARFSGQPDIAAELHAALGSSYVALELPPDTELNRALDLYEARQGIGSSPTLGILSELLSFRHTPAELDTLVARARSALTEGQRRYGRANEQVLDLRLALARAIFHQGEWTQAVADLSALSSDMDRYSLPAPHFAGDLSRLIGTVNLYLADFDQSEQWLRRAQSEIDRSASHSITSAASVHMSLGELFAEKANFFEADKELRTALDSLMRWVPDDSARVLQIRRIQGQLKLEEGRPQEASAMLEDVLRILSNSTHDTDREGSSLIRFYLGLAYQAQGRLAEAAEALRGSLERSELVNGPVYPITQQVRIALAETLSLQGRLDDAQELLSSVEKSRLPGLPKDHPTVGELRRTEGVLFDRRGDSAQARLAFTDALRIMTVTYAPSNWRVQRIQRQLSLLK
jgi:DNA-binding winged helix-turn-helix (wHTH) protein/tetratricopeptide (TPR) repeat protein/tRNA A-37 threonylcarbamoyl transferase component Bud32